MLLDDKNYGTIRIKSPGALRQGFLDRALLSMNLELVAQSASDNVVIAFDAEEI